jgi:hypothetical protein
MNLSVTTSQAVNKNLSLRLVDGASLENITGGSLNDTLTGNNLDNTLVGGPGNDNVRGGLGNDTYVFDADAALGSDILQDTGGQDLLDFSQTTTLGVDVNLNNTTAQVVNSFLTLTLPLEIENVVGGAKVNILIGNNLPNILIGGASSDTLKGNGGRDILIGGSGIDTIYGGLGEDIVIGGTVTYYDEGTKVIQYSNLLSLMNEWTQATTYAVRVGNLLNGGGLNGTNKLNSTTVKSDNGAIDQLFGDDDDDWFLVSPEDSVNDWQSARETKTVV